MNMFKYFMKGKFSDLLIEAKNDPSAVIIDVREEEAFRKSHIEGSINIPLDEIASAEIPEGKTPYLYCLTGARSAKACAILEERSFIPQNLGGISGYMGEYLTNK